MAADPAPAARLCEVVTRLEGALFPLGWEQPPCLVGVMASGAVELWAPPAVADPIGELVGLDAPAHWAAVGMLATGRVHDLATESGRHYGVRRGRARRARTGHFVDRSGVSVSFLRLGDDPPEVHRSGLRGDRVDDVCRRSLGLATAPAAVPIAAYWASCWLDRVLAAAAVSPTHVATWERVARHHIAVAREAPAPAVDALIAAGNELARVGSWEWLRLQVASGRRRVTTVGTAAAGWMDEGMFSRWALEELAPLGHLRGAVAEVVPAEVAADVDDVLHAWGLP